MIGALLGLWAADLYYGLDSNRKLQRNVQTASYATNIMLDSVYEIDTYVADASNNLNEKKYQAALQEIYAASAMIRTSLRLGHQALREWESISEIGAQAARQQFDQDRDQIGQRQQIRLGQSKPGGNGAI